MTKQQLKRKQASLWRKERDLAKYKKDFPKYYYIEQLEREIRGLQVDCGTTLKTPS
jgi:hypothetical protein